MTATIESSAVGGKVAVRANLFSDLAALRVGLDNYGSGSTEVITTVPTRRPKKQEFFRTSADPETQLLTQIYEDRDEQQVYIVAPEMREHLIGDLSYCQLHLGITRQGTLIVVPVKVPGEGEKSTPWHETARQAVQMAKTSWMRMSADMSLGAYRLYRAEGDLAEPKWPNKTFGEILEVAFKGKVIDNENHPVIQRLRGRI